MNKRNKIIATAVLFVLFVLVGCEGDYVMLGATESYWVQPVNNGTFWFGVVMIIIVT